VEGRVIDFAKSGAEPVVCANPRLPRKAYAPLRAALAGEPRWRDHLAVASSGTTTAVPGRNKWVLLSRDALLCSARAVNAWLGVTSRDRWLLALPDFHVGGLGILARAFLSRSPITRLGPWDPRHFVAAATESAATLSALVPAQLHDLVGAKLPSPDGLRAVVIGGGHLDPALYDEARALGWPVLPSYGLSECSSQVATATAGDSRLHILPHVEVGVDATGRLRLKSEALLSAYAFVEPAACTFADPKVNGFFTTADRGEVEADLLSVLGRSDDQVKIGGELVDLSRLDRWLDQVLRRCDPPGRGAALVALSDSRLGRVLHLVIDRSCPIAPDQIARAFNDCVLPYERVRAVWQLEALPRTELGKLARARLTAELEKKRSEPLVSTSLNTIDGKGIA
jgi:O-succinylbenzoic acid--CoA ligase